jgi:hypothetical protein
MDGDRYVSDYLTWAWAMRLRWVLPLCFVFALLVTAMWVTQIGGGSQGPQPLMRRCASMLGFRSGSSSGSARLWRYCCCCCSPAARQSSSSGGAAGSGSGGCAGAAGAAAAGGLGRRLYDYLPAAVLCRLGLHHNCCAASSEFGEGDAADKEKGGNACYYDLEGLRSRSCGSQLQGKQSSPTGIKGEAR